MAEKLDFSVLDKAFYRGVAPENRKQKDKDIEQGFSIVEDSGENPFLQAGEEQQQKRPEMPQNAASEPLQAQERVNLHEKRETASEGQIKASMDVMAARDYKKLYRIAFDFHKKWNPPTVNREYWKTHKAGEADPPEEELEYWERVMADILVAAAAGDNDPFLIGTGTGKEGLLTAIYEELEREQNRLRRAAWKGNGL